MFVVAGAEDKINPIAHAKGMNGAKVEIIEGASRMPQMEQAGKVNGLIKAHVQG